MLHKLELVPTRTHKTHFNLIIYLPRTALKKTLHGALKWNGPLAGLTLQRLRK